MFVLFCVLFVCLGKTELQADIKKTSKNSVVYLLKDFFSLQHSGWNREGQYLGLIRCSAFTYSDKERGNVRKELRDDLISHTCSLSIS